MQIKRFIGGSLESNGYVLYHRRGGDCLIIDPGYNHKVFIRFVMEEGLTLKGILLTHNHYDHVGAVRQLVKEFGCPVYMHREDCDLYREPVDVYMEDGDIIDLEGEEIEVISTPGHTAGSVCFWCGKDRCVFTGDTIFNVDLGRSDLETGSEEQMVDSIRNKVDKWENDVMIYPGHGDGCTMKKVRKINREFIDIVNGEGR